MADWTTLSNGAVGVGGLPSGTTVTALRDNPIAIAEGAAGAPRLYGKAAVPRPQQAELPVLSLGPGGVPVGDLHYSGGFYSRTTTDTWFQPAGGLTSILMSGTVRFSATQTAFSTEASVATCEIRILKNGTVVQTWSLTSAATGSPTTQTRSVDISISVGDVFHWEVRRSNFTEEVGISNQTISANDAYTRIGIPIKVSEL